jgi:uncharacterized protein
VLSARNIGAPCSPPQGGNERKKMMFETKRAPFWIIGLTIAAQFALDAFWNLVVFPHHWLRPLSYATDGFLNVTFWANIIMLFAVVVGVVFVLGHLKPRDVGLRLGDVWAAALFTAVLWACANLIVALGVLMKGAHLTLDPGWLKPVPRAGLLVGQIFGNALYEEIVYRGFLTVQVFLLLQKWGRNVALILAVVLVQAIFATIHVPMLIVAGHGWAEMIAILPQVFIAGVALATIYFMTGNLLMAVGAHALADAYMLIPRDATGLEENLGYLYVALALVFATVLLVRRRGPQASSTVRSRHPHR